MSYEITELAGKLSHGEFYPIKNLISQADKLMKKYEKLYKKHNEPYMESIISLAGGIKNSLEETGDSPDTFENVIESYKKPIKLKRVNTPENIHRRAKVVEALEEYLKNEIDELKEKLKSKSSGGSVTDEHKKRGRPSKSKPSEEPETIDRNVAAHMRINKDSEYTQAIQSLRFSDKITPKQSSSMLGDLEDNKYAKLDKALAKYNISIGAMSMREPSPEPKKKRVRQPKPVDTSKLQSLIHEINEHKKQNPVKLSSIQDFPAAPKPKPKASFGNKDKQTAYIQELKVGSLLKKIEEHKKQNPVKLASISEFPKASASEISTLKKTLKNKAKHLISDIEHSDLMKYISQF